MTDLDKAREWAECTAGLAHLKSEEIQAAVDVIQSLPDVWVDVEKVREVISGQLSVYTRDTVSHYIAEEITRNLEALIAPKLPTLADMTPEEREACQWMQCAVETDHEDVIGVIRRVWSKSADVIFQSGQSIDPEHRRVTPLPDLPKLQWPGSEVVETPALPEGMRLADHEEYGRVVVAPRANTHGEEYFYRLREDNPWGASHGYRPTEEFTFLDGGN